MAEQPSRSRQPDAYIHKGETLTIASVADTSGFAPIKATFASLPLAKSMAELR
jgi:hypothetical protein